MTNKKKKSNNTMMNKRRITLYMKYNVKDFKSIDFTSCERDPMGGYAIKGYINNNKN